MKPYKRITLADRREIEALYSSGKTPDQIAVRVGVHRSTIYSELIRGDTGEMDSNGRIGYSADLAQSKMYQQARRVRKTHTAETGGAEK